MKHILVLIFTLVSGLMAQAKVTTPAQYRQTLSALSANCRTYLKMSPAQQAKVAKKVTAFSSPQGLARYCQGYVGAAGQKKSKRQLAEYSYWYSHRGRGSSGGGYGGGGSSSSSSNESSSGTTVCTGSICSGPGGTTVCTGSVCSGPRGTTVCTGSVCSGPDGTTVCTGSVCSGPGGTTVCTGSVCSGPGGAGAACGSGAACH